MKFARLSGATPSLPDAQSPKFSVTDGGVKYFDLKEGTGYSPNPGQIVVLKCVCFTTACPPPLSHATCTHARAPPLPAPGRYDGYLENGKKFDSWTVRLHPCALEEKLL